MPSERNHNPVPPSASRATVPIASGSTSTAFFAQVVVGLSTQTDEIPSIRDLVSESPAFLGLDGLGCPLFAYLPPSTGDDRDDD